MLIERRRVAGRFQVRAGEPRSQRLGERRHAPRVREPRVRAVDVEILSTEFQDIAAKVIARRAELVIRQRARPHDELRDGEVGILPAAAEIVGDSVKVVDPDAERVCVAARARHARRDVHAVGEERPALGGVGAARHHPVVAVTDHAFHLLRGRVVRTGEKSVSRLKCDADKVIEVPPHEVHRPLEHALPHSAVVARDRAHGPFAARHEVRVDAEQVVARGTPVDRDDVAARAVPRLRKHAARPGALPRRGVGAEPPDEVALAALPSRRLYIARDQVAVREPRPQAARRERTLRSFEIHVFRHESHRGRLLKTKLLRKLHAPRGLRRNRRGGFASRLTTQHEPFFTTRRARLADV